MTHGDAAAKAAIRAARTVDSTCADTYRTISTLRKSIGSSTSRTPTTTKIGPTTRRANTSGKRARRSWNTKATTAGDTISRSRAVPGSVSWAIVVTTAAARTKKPRSSRRSATSRPTEVVSAPGDVSSTTTRLRRRSRLALGPRSEPRAPTVGGVRALATNPKLGKIRVAAPIWGSCVSDADTQLPQFEERGQAPRAVSRSPTRRVLTRSATPRGWANTLIRSSSSNQRTATASGPGRDRPSRRT